jgi:hypothetical protein
MMACPMVMGMSVMSVPTVAMAIAMVVGMAIMIMPVTLIVVMMIMTTMIRAGRIVRLVRGDRQFRSSVPPQPAGAIDRLRYNMI